LRPDAATDTIVAVATAPGRGGVGIVRVSGPDTRRIAESMLSIPLPTPRIATLAQFHDADGRVLDHGLALFFGAPHSYTGEDVLELQGHGGPVVLETLVQRAVSLGARRANAGEFTQRAFLNDKLDLAQAEAVADLIDAGSVAAARAAMRSLQGAFSAQVHELVEAVTELRVWVEAAIDFPEEEIDFLADKGVQTRLTSLRERFETVLQAARWHDCRHRRAPERWEVEFAQCARGPRCRHRDADRGHHPRRIERNDFDRWDAAARARYRRAS
jgi:tRNA modification GTPase